MEKEHLYWVGARLSDIRGIESMFKGAVVIYGENIDTEEFYCRPLCAVCRRVDHNDMTNDLIGKYYITEPEAILHRDPEARFLWYRGRPKQGNSSAVKARSVCYNSPLLCERLSDKAGCRLLMSKYMNVLGLTELNVSESIYSKLKNIFPDYETFVLQQIKGIAGGFGTHLLKKNNQNTLPQQLKKSKYLVSPYFRNSSSINMHMVVYEEEVVLFPGSIQITCDLDDKLQYFGGDFAAYDDLSSELKSQINTRTHIIGEVLQQMGYRGVAGVDYLVPDDNEIRFVEINPRFQGSTMALNQILLKSELPSIQQYHIEAFSSRVPSVRPERIIDVDYALVSYLNIENLSIANIYERLHHYSGAPEIELVLDGPVFENDADRNALMFRILCHSNVVSRIAGRTIKHPNIIFERLNNLRYKENFEDLSKLKIALLAHGIRVRYENMDASDISRVKHAVNKGFDLIFDHKWYVNACMEGKFSELSPFELIYKQGDIWELYYENTYISQVNIDMLEDLSDHRTQNNICYHSIAQFFTDRLRIHPFSTCCFGKKKQNACKFCELGNGLFEVNDYGEDDIFEVVGAYIDSDLPIEHFMIGGGTALDQESWERIIRIVRFIREKTNRRIYLMTVPPPIELLPKLYEAGVNEVGFNLELYDRKAAREYMPLKGQIPLQSYYDVFDRAVQLWGSSGNVRSLMMLGLESKENTLNGVKELCQRGVMPIISLFRPMYNTPLENLTPMSFQDIYDTWLAILNICRQYGLIPGPLCIACQNNTISLPQHIISGYIH
ncbi:MAG: ATP-grasp domain-containing protein [Lachnospiraceae bacterium]|nr:ATP-grasp domain-containing protein [Lachnospiraceae bacterium]